MADILRVKRRVSGAPGAPSTLANAEIAYNEVDHILYYGEGTGGGGGSASVVVGIAGQGLAYTTVPTMNGIANAGTATLWARGDHIHPVDTSRAPINSPAFTGVPTTASTPAPGDSTTKLATTAFVGTAVAAATAGVASFNTRTGAVVLLAADVTGVGGALLANPVFTGDPQAPTPASTDNDTSIATTAFVRSLRLDQFLAPNVDVSWGSHKITSLLDPTGPQDAATKNYVDAVAQGIDAKPSVRLATTVNLATISGVLTIDGILTVVGDRVLVKDQTTQTANGIFIVAAGAWPRATDADAWTELPGAYVFVEQGAVNADNGYLCTVDAGGTLGTTAITWVQFSGAGQITAGNGLTKTGNQIDVVGTAARISVAADSIDIDATYAGQTSIVTLGTIATGTWNASTIVVGRGGSGATTLTGYLKGTGTTPFTASATIPNTDLTGLGTMSIQNANTVAITGGTIDNVTFDMGTF